MQRDTALRSVRKRERHPFRKKSVTCRKHKLSSLHMAAWKEHVCVRDEWLRCGIICMVQGVSRPATRRGCSAGAVPALHHPHQSAHPHLPVRHSGVSQGHAVHTADVGPPHVPQSQWDALLVSHHHTERRAWTSAVCPFRQDRLASSVMCQIACCTDMC